MLRISSMDYRVDCMFSYKNQQMLISSLYAKWGGV